MRYMMPMLQQLCSELESCLVIELIQGMSATTTTTTSEHLSTTVFVTEYFVLQQQVFVTWYSKVCHISLSVFLASVGLGGTLASHLMMDAAQCHQLVSILNRLHVSLNHLETITTMRRFCMMKSDNITNNNNNINNNINNDNDHDNTSNTTCATEMTAVGETAANMRNTTTVMSNNVNNVQFPLMSRRSLTSSSTNNKLLFDYYDQVPTNSRASSANRRLSAASTYSGCGGVDDDDNDDEHDARHWDNEWDMSVLQLGGRDTSTTGT